jgi:preprotein translocase subunit SecA
MIQNLLSSIFGTKHDREIKRLAPRVDQMNALEPRYLKMSDAELHGQTALFRERIANGEPLDSLLHEAFAVCREGGRRVLGMRHFDVQLIGGIALHEGKIAEMKTGEGKTLVATLAIYLNALTQKGAHVVTVNDYLARRDAEWMGQLYNFLGVSIGVIQHDLRDAARKLAYGADITYGTNNEFGFDYLRDNMKYSLDYYVQRGHNFAVVDEVDSILIDEARTPLIISGPSEESTDKYYQINGIIPRMRDEEDYTVEEKSRTVALTESGIAKAEKLLHVDNLYDPANMEIVHHVNQALKAHTIFKRDIDYVVKDGEVIIVDEFTGRLMPGRRWSDGLHQAVEAKEGVKIASENQTLATITFQNYFRLYSKLSGMTGTADTEAGEFYQIYKLAVMVIPTNRPLIRKEFPDLIYRSAREKFDAVIEEVAECHENGQPVLIGTISIENSERLAKMLKKRGIKHNVLNAKYHEKEAEIVAQAGRHKQVTIATNMAGRGTDILLGGNPEFLAKQEAGISPVPGAEAHVTPEQAAAYGRALVKWTEICEDERKKVVAAGGLHIIGTERHEARRIDNQLRGRSGRQGDPGSSRFYLSLEDDLMRIFGGDRIQGLMGRLGMEEGVPIEHGMVTKAIENAQKRVEAQHFSSRKHLLEYDDVMNKQREVIYAERRRILENKEVHETVLGMIEDHVSEIVDQFAVAEHSEDWDMEGLNTGLRASFRLQVSIDAEQLKDFTTEKLREELTARAKEIYARKESDIGQPILRSLERAILLETIDSLWKDHLLNMDHLKEGIGLRGWGQKDPLVEYKREGFAMFQAMLAQIREDAVKYLFYAQPMASAAPSAVRAPEPRRPQQTIESHGESPADAARGPVKKEPRVGRNDPCPCGSGAKYKKCHGK